MTHGYVFYVVVRGGHQIDVVHNETLTEAWNGSLPVIIRHQKSFVKHSFCRAHHNKKSEIFFVTKKINMNLTRSSLVNEVYELILHDRGVGGGGAGTGWFCGGDGGVFGTEGGLNDGGVGAKEGARTGSSAGRLKFLFFPAEFLVEDNKSRALLFPFCSVTECYSNAC